MNSIVYPILIQPYCLKNFKDIIPPLPSQPIEPVRYTRRPPNRPTLNKENDFGISTFFWMIAFHGLMIFVAVKAQLIWIWAFYIIVTIALIGSLFSKEEKVKVKTNDELEDEYRNKMEEYENKLKEDELLYQKELSKYNVKLNEYHQEALVLQSKSNIYRYQKEQLRDFFEKIKKPIYSEVIYKKGVTENYFYQYLKKYFGEKIKTDLTIKDELTRSKEIRTYLPDYVYFDPDGLIIDIEIDEPYVGHNGEPIHYEGIDVYRDNFFIENNWIVIRFAEEQIIKQPEECCFFIAQAINEITNNDEHIKLFIKQNIPTPIRQWSKEEAHKLAFNRYRNKYLNITLQEKLSEEVNLGYISENSSMSTISYRAIDNSRDDLPF
jgi:hypothetical protein